jgi:predicted nucleic acid-binding Zn ribbon protein
MSDILKGQPTSPAKVAFAWRLAAGPVLSRATRARWTDDGTLHVTAAEPAWRREARRARPALTARLDALLGSGVVRRIDIADPKG